MSFARSVCSSGGFFSLQVDRICCFTQLFSYRLVHKVADRGCLSWILICFHPGISTKEKEEKTSCHTFFVVINFTKSIFYPNIVAKLLDIWVSDPGPQIRAQEKLSRIRIQGQKSPDPGYIITVRNVLP